MLTHYRYTGKLKYHENVFERNSHLPEYYPTMYQDGYTPYEIMAAYRKKQQKDYIRRYNDEESEDSYED